MNPSFSYPWAYLGLNDCPASSFAFWNVWFGALANPQRLDDEACPVEHNCFGSWAWRHTLEGRYGKENVQQITPRYLLARDVYRNYLDINNPIISDSCAYLSKDTNNIICNKSCITLNVRD